MRRRNVSFLPTIFAFTLLTMTACGGSSGPTGNNNPTVTGSVKGTVMDNTGAAVSGASVQLSAAGRTSLNTATSSTGAYTFTNVSTGLWTVTVEPPAGFLGGSSSVTVTANAEATASAIVLTKIPPGQAPTSVDVTITQQAVFSPQSVLVARGGTVRWTNQDITTHTATATGNSFDTGLLSPGASSTKTFATAGTFNYICSIHAGMTGTVTVQ